MKNKHEFTPGKPIRTYAKDGSWRDWSTDELVGAKLNYVPGWRCGAGLDSLYIDMDGGVWTASCRVGGKLGNVFEDFSVPDDWIDCTRNVCSCGADLFIPKVSKIEFKPLLLKGQALPAKPELRNDELTDFIEYLSSWLAAFSSLKSCTTLSEPSFFGTINIGLL